MNSKTLSLSLVGMFVVFIASCGSPVPPPTALLTPLLPTSTPTALNSALPATSTAPVPQQGKPFVCQITGPEVYLVFDTKRHHIVDWETFQNLGYKQEQIVACGASAAYAEGIPLTRLLKGSGDAVYWLENGLRRHIPDMETFRALGYREQDIAVVPDELLATWPRGEPLPSLSALASFHPKTLTTR